MQNSLAVFQLILSGGETARRVPARHGFRAGVRVHAVGLVGGDQEQRQQTHGRAEEIVHDDAAEGSSLLPPKQHHAQGL